MEFDGGNFPVGNFSGRNFPRTIFLESMTETVLMKLQTFNINEVAESVFTFRL